MPSAVYRNLERLCRHDLTRTFTPGIPIGSPSFARANKEWRGFWKRSKCLRSRAAPGPTGRETAMLRPSIAAGEPRLVAFGPTANRSRYWMVAHPMSYKVCRVRASWDAMSEEFAPKGSADSKISPDRHSRLPCIPGPGLSLMSWLSELGIREWPIARTCYGPPAKRVRNGQRRRQLVFTAA